MNSAGGSLTSGSSELAKGTLLIAAILALTVMSQNRLWSWIKAILGYNTAQQPYNGPSTPGTGGYTSNSWVGRVIAQANQQAHPAVSGQNQSDMPKVSW